MQLWHLYGNAMNDDDNAAWVRSNAVKSVSVSPLQKTTTQRWSFLSHSPMLRPTCHPTTSMSSKLRRPMYVAEIGSRMRSDSCCSLLDIHWYSWCLLAAGIYWIFCDLYWLHHCWPISVSYCFLPSMIVRLNWPCWRYFVVFLSVDFKQSAESAGIWGYHGFRRVIEPEASSTMDCFQDLAKMFQVHWHHGTLRIW